MLTSSLFLLAASLTPQTPDVPATLRGLAERSGGRAQLSEIGRSRGDRPIHLLTVASPDGPALDQRPALLVVAGAHGGHLVGTELALEHARRLLDADERTEALLRKAVVYIVPRLNPDGAALGRSGNSHALDLDRDGARDEDPHDDVNGDGKITQLRRRAPEGTWIIDPDEPRVLREAEPEKGERGVYVLAVEGLDNDGDGLIDEDGGDGVQLHRGFSHDFAEFDRQAGPLPLGEPAARALADFVFARRHIGMAVVYGPDDTLRDTPETDDGQRRAPLQGILDGDEDLYERVGELYREKTEAEGKARDRHDGSVWSWLYCDVGIPAFASDVYRLPTPDADAEGQKTEQQVRLKAALARGEGFVPWREVEHPTHGMVEVGGFVAEHESNYLPAGERDALFAAHHDWLLTVAGWRPRLALQGVHAKSRGGGVYELTAAVVNEGREPLLSAISARSRRFAPARLTLSLGAAALVAGQANHRIENLPGLGGRQELTWLVTAPKGTKLTLSLTSDFAGHVQTEVLL